MLTRRHVLPPSLLGEMARHRLVQNARSRSNSKTASLYPECNQTCAVHAHEHTAQNQTNFHVNGWASGPCKLKTQSPEQGGWWMSSWLKLRYKALFLRHQLLCNFALHLTSLNCSRFVCVSLFGPARQP